MNPILNLSIPQTPTSKQTVIEKLDDEIRSLTARLSVLRSERNSFSTTYTIPIEILEEIFTIVRGEYGQEVEMPWGSRFRKCPWLPITCVSQHWRKVALECPQLWCDIHIGTLPTPTIKTFLERSRGRGLSVNFAHYQQPRPLSSAGIELTDVFAEARRIEKLDLSLDRKSFLKIRPRLLSAPTPKLGTLSIAGPVDVPDHIFQGVTPELHSLSLSWCNFSPNFPLFTANITSLDILRCPAVGSTLMWLNVLRRMPQLSQLSLKSSFAGELHVPIPPYFDAVPLPQLSQLTIEGSLFDSDLDFLSHITFPSHTAVSFTSSTGASPSEPPMTLLVAVLRAHRRSCSSRDTSAVETNITAVKLEGVWTEDPGRTLIQFHAHIAGLLQPYLSITILTDSGEAIPVASTWTEMPMADIALLPISLATSFTTNCVVSEEGWEILSSRSPHLQDIEVSELPVQPFLSVLGAGDIDILDPNEDWRRLVSFLGGMEGESGASWPDDDEDTSNVTLRTGHSLFKSLKSIKLYDLDPLRFKEELINALTARCINGLPIEKIQLSRRGGVDNEFFFDLKGLVPLVEYDDGHDWNWNPTPYSYPL
ncbi:hypothetical protein BDN72DRAFT_844733 [Pluteus cervinus]|uniref:Uncharacterized protein n=1 Tax=Pluteus cervinus TaxID=181527 RepID=A0ACD3AKP5_9AGAR|nr:hypothetical protein BDN72DRAFT_844733 [Pluteus cervinus]